jgi:hypothetical protein
MRSRSIRDGRPGIDGKGHVSRPSGAPPVGGETRRCEVEIEAERVVPVVGSRVDSWGGVAAELEALTPEERQRLLAERVVTDLSLVSPKLLPKVRAKRRALLEEHGAIARQTDGG